MELWLCFALIFPHTFPFLASRTKFGLQSACLNGDSFLNLRHRCVIDFDLKVRAKFTHSSLVEHFFTPPQRADQVANYFLNWKAQPTNCIPERLSEPDEVIV
jgi:hypothetical protein